MDFKGDLPSAEPSQSDWERVRKQIADDAPIAYDPTDPDDGPYDPNDDEAVENSLTNENRVYPPREKEKKIAKAS